MVTGIMSSDRTQKNRVDTFIYERRLRRPRTNIRAFWGHKELAHREHSYSVRLPQKTEKIVR